MVDWRLPNEKHYPRPSHDLSIVLFSIAPCQWTASAIRNGIFGKKKKTNMSTSNRKPLSALPPQLILFISPKSPLPLAACLFRVDLFSFPWLHYLGKTACRWTPPVTPLTASRPTLVRSGTMSGSQLWGAPHLDLGSWMRWLFLGYLFKAFFLQSEYIDNRQKHNSKQERGRHSGVQFCDRGGAAPSVANGRVMGYHNPFTELLYCGHDD